jgi:polyisoprenoid-binding protein YceI
LLGCALALLVTAYAARAIAAETWRLLPQESRLGFTGTQAGSPFTGEFTRFKADIGFDADDPESNRVAVVIDMASATTGDKQKDAALPQPDWFAVSQHPEARFEAAGWQRLGDERYRLRGQLTIRDVTREVTLPVRLRVDGDRATAEGELAIDRTHFGVGQGSWASGQWIGLMVTISFEVAAERVAGDMRP